MGNFKEDISQVKAFVFDVDGVFTDGGITTLPDGDFMRTYNVKDGYAIAYALKMGYKICIITGGRGAMLEARFRILGVTDMHINCMDKLTALKGFIEKNDFTPNDIMYMGDDIPDLEVMNYVGMPVAPRDAVSEIIDSARYVSQYDGGRGCVRDVVEQVLRSHGVWAKDSFGVTAIPSA